MLCNSVRAVFVDCSHCSVLLVKHIATSSLVQHRHNCRHDAVSIRDIGTQTCYGHVRRTPFGAHNLIFQPRGPALWGPPAHPCARPRHDVHRNLPSSLANMIRRVASRPRDSETQPQRHTSWQKHAYPACGPMKVSAQLSGATAGIARCHV